MADICIANMIYELMNEAEIRHMVLILLFFLSYWD